MAQKHRWDQVSTNTEPYKLTFEKKVVSLHYHFSLWRVTAVFFVLKHKRMCCSVVVKSPLLEKTSR